MNKEFQISNRQLWFILFIMRTTIIVSTLPVLTTDSLQDAWISAIITLIGSELILLLITVLDTRFPELTIIEYSRKLLGKIGGGFLSIIFLWVFLQFSVLELRIYAEVLKTAFLPRTPIFFIAMIMVLAATICVYNGIETLARSADILFFLYIIMLLFILFIPLTDFEPGNLAPVFTRGWGPVVRGSLTPITYIAQTWVLTMLSPLSENPKKTMSTALTSVGVSLFVLIIFALLTIGSLGAYEGARASFPLLFLIRSIEVTRFLQRTEVLVMFSWGFGLFVSVATYLYAGAMGITQWFNLEDYRNLVLPMGIIWIFMSVHGFENIFALNTLLTPRIFAVYGIFILVLPLIILWISYLIKKWRKP